MCIRDSTNILDPEEREAFMSLVVNGSATLYISAMNWGYMMNYFPDMQKYDLSWFHESPAMKTSHLSWAFGKHDFPYKEQLLQGVAWLHDWDLGKAISTAAITYKHKYADKLTLDLEHKEDIVCDYRYSKNL